MSTDEQMTIDERRKYLRKMRKRYQGAQRGERSRLLDEMQAVTELHRKSLIRLMGGDLQRKPRRRQRGRQYGPEVEDALRVIAESVDHICAERLQPNLVWLAEHLAQHQELHLSPQLKQQLGQISISTVKRIFQRLRQDERRLPRRKPAWGKAITRDIPMRQIAWDEPEPGHFEVDLVHHCGPEPSGEYVHTLQLIDVTTGWSERVAVLGRSYRVMKDAFERTLARLPFPVLEFHPDNGSEFLNQHLLRFFKEQVKLPKLSRSRPHHKNDNRFVEQKNNTLVRDPLGYQRFDSVTQTLAINQLYDQMWLYYNFFQPVMRVNAKIVIPTDRRSVRIKRRYDRAQTPLDRLCATQAISSARRADLLNWRQQINPRLLRQAIYNQVETILQLPNAIPGVSEDVYLTLKQPILFPKGVDSPVTLSFAPMTPAR